MASITDYPRDIDHSALPEDIKRWGVELGFDAVGIAHAEMGDAEARLLEWLGMGRHGTMDYMARHGVKRARPAELIPGTLSIVCVRLNYTPGDAHASDAILQNSSKAFISRYALGRDYHKVLRAKLQKLADRITCNIGEFRYRVFTDSAPVMEVELARQARLGWRGKHTLLLSREAGSAFFLGELFTDLPLPRDQPRKEHCGTCQACIDVCPTRAIVAPYELDARRCISYLTIEHKGTIPLEFRAAIGNRVYGCDDCQLICPWNRFAQPAKELDFAVRHGLDDVTLVELFAWSEAQFLSRMAGSAILRIGYEQWLRNLAVGLGNAPSSPETIGALRQRAEYPSALVREHVAWGLEKHRQSIT